MTKEQRREYMRVWNKANKERRKALNAAWKKANPEKVAAHGKKWRQANKEKTKALRKKWGEANKDKKASLGRAWRKANPERVAEHFKRHRATPTGWATSMRVSTAARAGTRSVCPSWSDRAVEAEMYALAKSLTEGSLNGTQWVVDHIVPLISPLVCGLHAHTNLQVITAVDNVRKSSRHWPDMP